MYNITPHGRVKISKDTVKVGNLTCFIYVNNVQFYSLLNGCMFAIKVDYADKIVIVDTKEQPQFCRWLKQQKKIIQNKI